MNNVFVFKLSLGWRNLVHNKTRFFAALMAIGLAVFLMFLQMGFRNAMLNSSVLFMSQLNTNLILVSKRRYTSFIEQTFKKNRLEQVQGFAGIEAAAPLYISTAIWKKHGFVSQHPIRVFGIDLARASFMIPEFQQYQVALRFPNTVLADRKSRSKFGLMQAGTKAELDRRQVNVIGTFELGTDFIADGNLIASEQNFLRMFAGHPSNVEGNIRRLDDIDLGLIKTFNNVNNEQIVKLVNPVLPADVVLFTKEEFIQRELKYWNQATPIGFVFLLGTIVAFVVGVLIVYDIISADIGDNLPRYAMLKAIGYSNLYLKLIVMSECLILAVMGFSPGVVFSTLVYDIAAKTTGLAMHMEWSLILLVFSLTLCMCGFSGWMTTRKLHSIDPADVYE